MPESQDHPCRNYSMLPVRGFGLAVDISALEKDCPGDEQIAHAAMPSSVAVAIPLDVEPGSDLAAMRVPYSSHRLTAMFPRPPTAPPMWRPWFPR